jgi:hypothetical protein
MFLQKPAVDTQSTRVASLDDVIVHALPVLPMLAFLSFTLAFAVNVPVGDDYVILGDVVDLHQASGGAQVLGILWSAYLQAEQIEHRLVTTRILAYLASLMPGGLDFRMLSLLATLALFGALALFANMLRLGRRWDLWLILFLVVLQPQLEKLMFYPMGAVQAYFGLLFELAYLYLTIQGGRTPLAMATLSGAVLTSGAGIVLPLLGVPILAARRDWRGVLVHAAVGALLVATFLIGAGPRAGAVGFALDHPWQTLRLFLGVLGSVAEIPVYRLSGLSAYLIIPLGLALLAYAATVGYRASAASGDPRRDADGVLLVALAFALMLAATIAVNRIQVYNDSWLRAALDGRYRIYGLLVFAACAIDLVRRAEKRERWQLRAPLIALTAAAALNVVWYAYRTNHAVRAADSRSHALALWVRNGDPSELPSWNHPADMAGQALSRAVKAGVFKP